MAAPAFSAALVTLPPLPEVFSTLCFISDRLSRKNRKSDDCEVLPTDDVDVQEGASPASSRTDLDNTNSDSLPHVSDSESSKGRVVGVSLDTEGLLGNELDDGGVSGLDELGAGLHDLTSTLSLISFMHRKR